MYSLRLGIKAHLRYHQCTNMNRESSCRYQESEGLMSLYRKGLS
nr:MAG TPA: hypothetical protein [Bacteriophage sp.]